MLSSRPFLPSRPPGPSSLPPSVLSAPSPSAIDLIRGLLVVDPSRRLTAFESLQHPWVVSIQAHASDLLAEAPDAQGGAALGAEGAQPLFRDRIGEFNLQRCATRPD